jgi:hypothetical protein
MSIRFQVLTVRGMKMAVFWDAALCSLIFTNISEVLNALMIRPITHCSDAGGNKHL